MLYWFLKRFALGPILRIFFRPWVEGAEHIPEEGPAILASNHLSFSDSIFLPLVLKRRVTFLAKSDYFTGRGIKGWLTATFMRGVGQLPVDRSGGKASNAALKAGMKVLRRGELLGIYPEGTRSPDGRLFRGRTGVARLALEAKVPVLPVVMVGTDEAQPTGRIIPKITRVGVRIGAPLDFSRYEGMEEDRFVLRSVTDEILYELMRLSSQEYVDEYASTMKDKLKSEKARRRAGHTKKDRTTKEEAKKAAPATGTGEHTPGDQAQGDRSRVRGLESRPVSDRSGPTRTDAGTGGNPDVDRAAS